VVHLSAPSAKDRETAWRDSLASKGLSAASEDIGAVAKRFSLYPSQIDRATAQAQRRMGVADEASWEVLAESARRQCTTSLDAFATRVEPIHTWDHLILPAPTFRRLREFAGRRDI
jgi:hypothetical protein